MIRYCVESAGCGASEVIAPRRQRQKEEEKTCTTSHNASFIELNAVVMFLERSGCE